MPAVSDVAEFLRLHPPFDLLEDGELESIATSTEIAFHPSGETIFAQGAGAVDCVWVVRTGSVEMIFDGTVLDLAGEGELFGQASMLSGLPTGFTARAAEDCLVYRIPATAVQALLERPRALRFLVRTLLSDPIPGAGERAPSVDPMRRAAAALVRMPLVTCRPDEPIRDAARSMTARNVSAVVVEADGLVGIVTDTDLRSKVIAAGLDPSAPIERIMSAPVVTIAAERLGGDALLEMLERGIQHLVVTTAGGQVVGVLEDHDLVSAETRTPFVLRRQIARAASEDEVVAAAQRLRPAVVALRRTGARASQVSAMWSVVVDALTRRLLDLAVADVAPPLAFSWLALGSFARREAVPSSDLDTALVWIDPLDVEAARAAVIPIAERVTAGLARCGLYPDGHRVSAADPLFARPLSSWQSAARSLLADPSQAKSAVIASVLLDSRSIWGCDLPQSLDAPFVAVAAADRLPLLRMLARYALTHRPPTGFLRDFVVESSGERRGTHRPQGRWPAADRRPRALGRSQRRRRRRWYARTAARGRSRGGAQAQYRGDPGRGVRRRDRAAAGSSARSARGRRRSRRLRPSGRAQFDRPGPAEGGVPRGRIGPAGPARRVPGRRAVIRLGRTPWTDVTWCVVDVETTGLDRRVDQIISVAAVPIREGRIRPGEALSTLVNSDRPPSAESVRVHGIRAADLIGAPSPDDVAARLAEHLDGAIVVAHYAPVERAFLPALLALAGSGRLRRVADTELLGRLWLHERDGGVRGHLALGDLVGELGLPVHRPHDALGDALTTAQAFLALASLLSAGGRPETAGSLLAADRRLANARVSISGRLPDMRRAHR